MFTFQIELKIISIIALLTTAVVLQSCGRKHHSDDEAPAASPEQPKEEPKLDDPLNDKELRLRGYVELSSLVESSMLTTKGEFSFDSYLDSLTPLLGFYSATPANPGWRNTSANTISTATHLLAFDELAIDLAANCENADDSSRPAKAKPAFKELLAKYCTTPNLSDEEYQKVWNYLTAGVVPASEFPVWQTEMKAIENQPTKERFEVLVTTAMTSPWFIFKN